jgi:sigma-B regulation protein RsbU (phosphoserine phosphatase)
LLVRAAITLLIVSTVIIALGAAAVTVYAIRLRHREKFLLWFGLFSILYGLVLVARNSVFRLGFGPPQNIGLHIERLIALSAIVPGLLLFEEFYGRGWRSSLRWLLWSYCVLAVAVMSGVVRRSPLEWILFPGSALVIMVPLVLAMGYFTGYQAPPVPNRRALFAGLVAFFCTFSIDRVVQAELGHWRVGIEPYGFLALVVCLSYVTAQRVLADDKQLLSLTDEMRVARRIQEAILPSDVPSLENVRTAVRYAPMTAVAGDLYDFPPAPPNCMAVFVADVMGHGVPAALVAAMVKVAVSRPCGHDSGPAMVIAGLNTILCYEAREQYATAVYLCLDTVSGAGRYSAAAHPPPLLWRRAKQSLEVLGETGLLLGVRPKEAYADSEFSFEVGDRLLLYTDGLLEAENAAGESFGDAALATFIKERQEFEAEQFVDLLLNEVLAWSCDGTRARQADDITIVVLDIYHGATVEEMTHSTSTSGHQLQFVSRGEK